MQIAVVIYLAALGAVFLPFFYRILRHVILRRKAARLPDSLADPKPDRIGSIAPGKGSFLWTIDITIDRSGRVWVEPNTKLTPSPLNRDLYLRRETKGWVLVAQDTVTLRRDRKVYWLIASYDPVVEIVVATGQEWKAAL
jgi:hypothetical protein